jgi:N-hydroxyarylamine O-acetyltransferase
VDLRAYFARIGYDGDATPTLETLRAMQRAHFYHVPFENLDIKRGVRIHVDDAINFDKVVTRRRGGFCLELSGLFATALRQIGFRVDMIAARVLFEGKLSAPMSHMTLLVHLDERWIADVGFGGRIAAPLRLDARDEQRADGRSYVVAEDGGHYIVTATEPASGSIAYVFSIQPRAFAEFAPVCEWLQTSPDSRFTKGDIVSLATPSGRMTLAQGKFIAIAADERQERAIESEQEAREILRERFGLTLP